MQVGWIGLGAMGAPMALRVVRTEHAVAGYARRPHEHEALRSAGALVGCDLAEAVQTAELVCVSLFSEAQIREVLLEGGALAVMPAGALLAIHSTVSPTSCGRSPRNAQTSASWTPASAAAPKTPWRAGSP